jgi:hypothetical protein
LVVHLPSNELLSYFQFSLRDILRCMLNLALRRSHVLNNFLRVLRDRGSVPPSSPIRVQSLVAHFRSSIGVSGPVPLAFSRATNHGRRFATQTRTFGDPPLVAAVSWLKYASLAYLSRPKSDRAIFRLLKRHQITRMVEVGIRDVERTCAFIEVAERFAGDKKVSYTGLDWFDARPADQPALTLKHAHAALKATGAQVRLVPGAPARSISSVANAHLNTELLLVARSVSDDEMSFAWFYVPRMLRASSLVFREQLDAEGQPVLKQLSIAELATRAERAALRRVA